MASIEHDPHQWRNFIGFGLLGALNNFTYVVVNSTSKKLAQSFHASQYIGAILWANVISGVFIQMINAFLLENSSVRIRMLFVTLFFALGIGGVAVSTYVNFEFLLVAVVMVGTGTTFGQCVLLGYLNNFKSSTVGGWSSGTGIAGIAGSLSMILFSYLDFSVLLTFAAISPLLLVYLFTFFVVLKKPQQAKMSTASIQEAEEAQKSLLPQEHLPSHARPEVLSTTNQGTETGFQRFKRCGALVAWKAFNMGAVYFFEYVVSVGCAALAEPKEGYPHGNFLERNSFVVLSFCYQFGVFFSRSSLYFFKVKRIEVLSVLQAGNMVLWIMDDTQKFMHIYVQFAAMFYCGLLGGTSYVNTFYLIRTDPKIPDEDRTLCTYITALAINFGISSAAAFTLMMDATFLKPYQLSN